MDEEDLVDDSAEHDQVAEYIFLIDRSGSMHNRIKLARQALITFLQSLPVGSRFNICSYGSRHEFMYPQCRSVPYTDNSLKRAIQQVSTFKADFGGTKIYEPLK